MLIGRTEESEAHQLGRLSRRYQKISRTPNDRAPTSKLWVGAPALSHCSENNIYVLSEGWYDRLHLRIDCCQCGFSCIVAIPRSLTLRDFYLKPSLIFQILLVVANIGEQCLQICHLGCGNLLHEYLNLVFAQHRCGHLQLIAQFLVPGKHECVPQQVVEAEELPPFLCVGMRSELVYVCCQSDKVGDPGCR